MGEILKHSHSKLHHLPDFTMHIKGQIVGHLLQGSNPVEMGVKGQKRKSNCSTTFINEKENELRRLKIDILSSPATRHTKLESSKVVS